MDFQSSAYEPSWLSVTRHSTGAPPASASLRRVSSSCGAPPCACSMKRFERVKVMLAPPWMQVLPSMSAVRRMVPACHASSADPLRLSDSGRSLVEAAYAAPGTTVREKGDPGRGQPWFRKPTCSQYFPARPTEYET